MTFETKQTAIVKKVCQAKSTIALKYRVLKCKNKRAEMIVFKEILQFNTPRELKVHISLIFFFFFLQKITLQ